jgi:outer membrane cobalamin receptor
MDFENASAIPSSGNIMNYSLNLTNTMDNFYYMLGYNKDNHDGFVGNSTENNQSLYTKLGYNFSETTYLDFLYNFNRFKTTGLSFLESDLYTMAYGVDYAWHYTDDADTSSQVGSLTLSSLVTPALNLEAQVKFNRMDMENTRTYREGSFEPAGSYDFYKFHDQKVGFTVKGAYNPSELFSLVSGVDYYRVTADFTEYIADQPVIHIDEWAPFVNAEFRLGPVGLHAGARYDYNSSFGSQLSPSLGANINFMKASLVRLNLARTFKVPPLWYTLGEAYADYILPNPDLEPERAWAYSGGFESQELEYVWVKISGYYHRMTDGIVRALHPTEAGRYTWANADKFTRKGYEAELGFIIPYGFTLYGGTNYNEHSNTEAGTITMYIPTRSYKVRLKYFNEKLGVNANVQGRYLWWNEDDESAELFEPRDKVWLIDFRVSKNIKMSDFFSVKVFADVYNLLDKLYWDRKDLPNPRRWAQIGFEIKYK